tara:strand:- start:395 stop:514 length:120 start_codon:yes stop_codon:yes gene_type:complete
VGDDVDALDLFLGIDPRVDAQEEIEGVDIISHGERGYEF